MGCSPRIQQIVGMGKDKAAEYVKTCRNPEILYEILDRILCLEISIDDRESIDWIRWLMAGGNTPENFTAIVREYHNATICGAIWTAQTIAYRCRTCNLSPCMSLCSECFVNGKHDGHDYIMFRSQTGGACDCGDSSVMKHSGFCSKHGTTDTSKNVLPPPDLLYVAELMAPRIFCRLILHLRNNPCQVDNSEIYSGGDHFLAMLCDLNDMGAAMMRVLTSALTNTEVYEKLTQEWPRDDSTHATYMTTSENLYKLALNSLQNLEPPTEFKNCPGLQVDLKHKTFLEELVFWTVKYEFPQKLVNFLLVMLPDPKYKEALTEAFVIHYSRIVMVLERSADPDPLCRRMSKISVQWFSNKEVALKMTENLSILQVMIVSLKNMFCRSLISVAASSTTSESKSLVIDCGSSVVIQYRYWIFVSDLNSIFSYEPVAMKFMNDESLIKELFSLLSYFQDMNMNQRKYNQHVEYESDMDPPFVAELWISTLILPLLTHWKDETTAFLTKRLLSHCLETLEKWLQSVKTIEMVEDQVSFHIPLHRVLATLISHAVNVQHMKLSEVMPPDDLLRRILPRPLRIQAVFREIINGLWIRNGLQVKKLALTYTQTEFCSSMIDPDLFLLQIIGTRLLPNEFMKATLKEFKLSKWFRFRNQVKEDKVAEDESKEDATFEGFLQFWATLCVNRMNLGNSQSQNIRSELVTLLCVADRTHSQLIDQIPDRYGAGKSPQFDTILAEVADYKPPNLKYDGNMQQGLYTPKEMVWNELYDPIHVLLRTGLSRKDVQNAIDRFGEHMRKNKQSPSAGVPWGPYRIPVTCEAYRDPRYMLNGRIFHSLVWLILYKYVHQGNVSENILSLTIYLLELAASIADEETNDSNQVPIMSIDVTDLNLENWFASDLLAENVRTEIRKVNCTSSSSSQTNIVEANESIISLLLKCYAKLGGRDSFSIVENSDVSVLDNRIGDGVAFIEKTLIRINLLNEMCRETVKNCYEKLYSKMSSSLSEYEEEKKRKAREHRNRMMKSLAQQREKFAKENESMLVKDKMDWQPSETSESGKDERIGKYYCSICHKMLPSTVVNPIMLLTQVQPTKVLGHRKSSTGVLFANQQLEEARLLGKEFSHWSDSMTCGSEGGVYVQSCGHMFDNRCLKPVQQGEYSCPVCRQSANNVIPILPFDFPPNIIENKSFKKLDDWSRALAQIGIYLKQIDHAADRIYELFKTFATTSLENISRFLKDSTLLHHRKSKQSSYSMVFLTSIVRYNLEMELVVHGGSLVISSQEDYSLVTKKSCILSLVRLVGLCARTGNRKACLESWQQLVGSSTTPYRESYDKPNRRCIMPLLLRDPIAVLLLVILGLPVNLLRSVYFEWIVKLLYMLVIFQSAVRLSYQLTKERRNYFRLTDDKTNSDVKIRFYDAVMKMTVQMLDSILEKETCVSEVQVEAANWFPESCLPFLRVASILRSHVFKDQLPLAQNAGSEYETLLKYLQLTNEVPVTKSKFIKTWFTEFEKFVMSNDRSSAVTKELLCKHIGVSWCQPELIPLPQEYKDLFQKYQQKPCIICEQTNEKISLCLVCGTLVCLQKRCCERDNICEGVRHANECGAGTGIYLTISSSNVMIICGPKSCIWGSVYLDAYGEEDPDLKRGRPLFLSKDRYHLLKRDWLSHNFNRIHADWILHRNQL